MKQVRRIAVVGGGFSGAMAAVQILKQSDSSKAQITLFEPRGVIGKGLAYGTSCEAHLLNVPAGKMSAFPDDPEHFLRWLQSRNPKAAPQTFAPRPWYGEYVSAVFETARAQHPGRVEVVSRQVDDIRRGKKAQGFEICADGKTDHFDAVVLAIGHLPALDPIPVSESVLRSGLYVRNPWDRDVLEGISESKPLVLLGSGLTAMDLMLEARAREFKGKIVLLSRRGFLPRQHAPSAPTTTSAAGRANRSSLRALLAEFRALIRDAASDTNWRSFIDVLRPDTQALWQSLPVNEKKRFLRHVRPYWEIHRHRVAPEVYAQMEREVSEGQLVQISARLSRLEAGHGAIDIYFRRRGTGIEEKISAQRAINCTGPGAGLEASCPDVLQSLLQQGLCRVDPLGIGIEASSECRVLDAQGCALPDLFVLGPLLKGQLWETTAVPELKGQAQTVGAAVTRFIAG